MSTPKATDSRNDSFITDHGSMREIASRTRRGPPECGATLGIRPVLGRALVGLNDGPAGADEPAAPAPDEGEPAAGLDVPTLGGAVGVVVIGVSSVRGRVAVEIFAVVAPATFLIQPVVVSTATMSGDGGSWS
ncbi:hypothetical protein CCO02nite_27810 [Cellulomonas composti]|uniref:Uncharacterized protein n=1 Tax=Cellulomonas composti TaxID=266130 RepID=A0A511JEF7_9CELL|nr:hypothetical protein CCO02nite_27810 [Cellulomonas composti]